MGILRKSEGCLFFGISRAEISSNQSTRQDNESDYPSK